MPRLVDIPAGWQDIVRRCADEIACDIDMFDLDEDMGRLRISVDDVKVSKAVRRAFLLAQFRSLYTCPTCGRPGRHRQPPTGPRFTACNEHTPPALRDFARVVYDRFNTPWRRMSDADWAYDDDSDSLERLLRR